MGEELDPENFIPADPVLTKLQEVLDELELQKVILNDIKTNTSA